jgi:hypothetical protein
MDPAAFLPTGLTRETQIRRDAKGRWWNGADAITHPMLVRAFDAWIGRAPDGRYCLSNDINWAYVTVEGAPIDVRAVRIEASRERERERCVLTLSDGREEPLALTTVREGEDDGALYCDVRGGTLPARFDPHAAMQLGEAAVDTGEGVALEIGGVRHVPPRVADPLAVQSARAIRSRP